MHVNRDYSLDLRYGGGDIHHFEFSTHTSPELAELISIGDLVELRYSPRSVGEHSDFIWIKKLTTHQQWCVQVDEKTRLLSPVGCAADGGLK
jgi:hypothetical protein